MIHFVGEHRAEDRVAQVFVALVAGEVGIQVLNRVVQMLLDSDLLVVAFLQGFSILFCAVFRHLRDGKHGVRRQKVKGVGRIGLAAAQRVCDDGCIRLYSRDDSHQVSPLL
jgi:hypothetical protein